MKSLKQKVKTLIKTALLVFNNVWEMRKPKKKSTSLSLFTFYYINFNLIFLVDTNLKFFVQFLIWSQISFFSPSHNCNFFWKLVPFRKENLNAYLFVPKIPVLQYVWQVFSIFMCMSIEWLSLSYHFFAATIAKSPMYKNQQKF